MGFKLKLFLIMFAGLLSNIGFGQKLPEPDFLYEKFVKPWDNNNDPLLPKKLKPDMQGLFKAGYGLEKLKEINWDFENTTKNQIDAMCEAVFVDFKDFGKLDRDNLLNTIDILDKVFDRKFVKRVIDNSDPNKFDNEYLLHSIEFGALIGKYFEKQAGYFWFYEYPYWESVIVHQKTGTVIPVFHWGFKKFSNYGVEDGFKLKVHQALQIGKK